MEGLLALEGNVLIQWLFEKGQYPQDYHRNADCPNDVTDHVRTTSRTCVPCLSAAIFLLHPLSERIKLTFLKNTNIYSFFKSIQRVDSSQNGLFSRLTISYRLRKSETRTWRIFYSYEKMIHHEQLQAAQWASVCSLFVRPLYD